MKLSTCLLLSLMICPVLAPSVRADDCRPENSELIDTRPIHSLMGQIEDPCGYKSDGKYHCGTECAYKSDGKYHCGTDCGYKGDGKYHCGSDCGYASDGKYHCGTDCGYKGDGQYHCVNED